MIKSRQKSSTVRLSGCDVDLMTNGSKHLQALLSSVLQGEHSTTTLAIARTWKRRNFVLNQVLRKGPKRVCSFHNIEIHKIHMLSNREIYQPMKPSFKAESVLVIALRFVEVDLRICTISSSKHGTIWVLLMWPFPSSPNPICVSQTISLSQSGSVNDLAVVEGRLELT